MFTEIGTFTDGILCEDGLTSCRYFRIQEQTFRHSLELANDPAFDRSRLSDPVYYDAAMIAKRLTVDGIPQVTPEMVLDLSADDGEALMLAMGAIEKRRAEFRTERAKLSPETGGAPEDRGGLPEHP